MQSHNIEPIHIFKQPNLYLLIDAAQEPELIKQWLYQSPTPQVRSLFEKTPEAQIPLYAAPLLLKVHTKDLDAGLYDLIDVWLKQNTFLNTISTTMSADMLIDHLRPFLEAHLPSGKNALFRFYDPTVACLLDKMLSMENYTKLMKPLDQWWYANDEGSFNALPSPSNITNRG